MRSRILQDEGKYLAYCKIKKNYFIKFSGKEGKSVEFVGNQETLARRKRKFANNFVSIFRTDFHQ